MIGSIKGILKSKTEGSFLVEVAGVGYKITVPTTSSTGYRLEEEVFLHTHLYVREDQLTLYGFESESQLRLFELLIGVSGIGPKMALAVLSNHSAEEIVAAISKANSELFQSISGIGKKNAQRIIVDLQSKLGVIEELVVGGAVVDEEMVNALVNFGYSARDVRKVIRELDEGMSQEEQLKEALKRLGS